MIFGRRKRTVNLEKGKALYYEYYGNKFGIWHELRTQYDDCNVPKEIELEWKKDILNKLEKEIDTAQGAYLAVAVGRYIYLTYDAEWLMRLLQARVIDTFTAIILCEELKDMMLHTNDKQRSARIRLFLDEYKTELLNNPIIIHETYKTDKYLRDYDFSDNNIRSRIIAI